MYGAGTYGVGTYGDGMYGAVELELGVTVDIVVRGISEVLEAVLVLLMALVSKVVLDL